MVRDTTVTRNRVSGFAQKKERKGCLKTEFIVEGDTGRNQKDQF